MRGAFLDQGGLFSYISPDARVPANHPLRKIRELVRGGPGGSEPQLWDTLRERRTSLDPAGAIAERLAAAGVLRHPVGTTADGATYPSGLGRGSSASV
jgi:hypothetical protein